MAGRADLAGVLQGAATGRYDAGGTLVPYDGGELVVRARQLQDFAGLNQRLTAGGVVGGRSFQIGEGDLRIGDEVKARRVDISVDAGSLTVAGRIDASGEQVGSIRLYARDQLQVDGTLDAHGTGLRVDSHGKIIDSPTGPPSRWAAPKVPSAWAARRSWTCVRAAMLPSVDVLARTMAPRAAR